MIRGKTLYHCHGKEKGKKLWTYESHAAALRAHRAIMAKKMSGMSVHNEEQRRRRQEIFMNKLEA